MARKSEPLRQRVPERTCTKTYKSYRSFKKDLRKDFNRRCGYCDDHDDGFWRGFQIDHFIPQTQLQKIQDNDYGNLVYSCFFCNNSKGQDWPSNDELVAVTPARHGYIDPCSNQYDAQYHRDKDGKIIQSGTALGAGSNIPGFDDLLFILLKQSGLEMVDGNGYAIFNTGSDLTQTVSVINFLSDYANSARDTYSWNEKMSNALDQFANGSLAFFFGYSYHLPTIKARAPQLNIEVIPMLQLSASADKQINAANYWVQSVVKKSNHQSEAWAFINYIARSSANKTYLDNTGRPSALRAYITEQSKKTELAPFAAQALVAENWYYGKDYSSAQKALADLFINWLTTPVGIDQAKWHIQILNNTAAKINQTL